MSIEAEVAGESVKFALEGGIEVLKFAGPGAVSIGKAVWGVLSTTKKTKGKARLEAILSEPDGAIGVTISKNDYEEIFKKNATSYGIKYAAVKDEHPESVIVMCPAKQSQQVKLLLQRNGINQLSEAEAGIGKDPESERGAVGKNERADQSGTSENAAPERAQEKSPEEKTTEEVLKKPIGAEQAAPENPTAARTAETATKSPSEQSSGIGETSNERNAKARTTASNDEKPSVKEKLEQNKKVLKERKADASRSSERQNENLSQRRAQSSKKKDSREK